MTPVEAIAEALTAWQPSGSGRQIWSYPIPAADWAVNLTADRADSVGCATWELVLTRTGTAPARATTRGWADKIAARVTGLLEPLESRGGGRRASAEGHPAKCKPDPQGNEPVLLRDRPDRHVAGGRSAVPDRRPRAKPPSSDQFRPDPRSAGQAGGRYRPGLTILPKPHSRPGKSRPRLFLGASRHASFILLAVFWDRGGRKPWPI